MADILHWDEGLFLQPHHLQQLQRSFTENLVAERRRSWAYPYGLVDAQLAPDELANFRVKFDRLTAVMPNGLVVDYPRNAELPPLDIKEALIRARGSLVISLALPLWSRERANTLGKDTIESQARLLFCLKEMEIPDENSGGNPQPVVFRRLNARLVIGQEDRAEQEIMPLVRVVAGAGQEVGMPRRDGDFVGPCLLISGAGVLQELWRDLISQVDASRKELLVQITRGGFNLELLRGVQIEQLLRLRTLNRFAARLTALGEAPALPTFQAYLELRELLAELAALHPDRDEYDAPNYNHDAPMFAFKELSRKIRGLLRGAVAPSFEKIDFARQADAYTATLTPDHFTKPNDYFLAIETKSDPRALIALVEDPDRFKVLASSYATRAIRGLKLKEERTPPLELPAKNTLFYFRILRQESGRMWDALKTERSAVIRLSGVEACDFSISLYMTIPS